MSDVFDALPGEPTPVGEVQHALTAMWDAEPEAGGESRGDYRASQMNLVLHPGLDASPEDARRSFDSALRFSRRYPCRIIVLCPRRAGKGGPVVAKVYSVCFIGEARRDMTCTDAIMLGYSLEDRAFVEDQASIMLESDLPVYYWPQRINAPARLDDFKFFIREAQRVVIDSAVEKSEVLRYAWPRPEVVRDLAYARVLPIRQNVGHFLSYLAPARIVNGLREVRWRCRPPFEAEGRQLLEWSRRGIAGCARQAGADEPAFEGVAEVDAKLETSMASQWTYADGGRLEFGFDLERGSARLMVSLGGERNVVRSSVRLLAPENALGEALFF